MTGRTYRIIKNHVRLVFWLEEHIALSTTERLLVSSTKLCKVSYINIFKSLPFFDLSLFYQPKVFLQSHSQFTGSRLYILVVFLINAQPIFLKWHLNYKFGFLVNLKDRLTVYASVSGGFELSYNAPWKESLDLSEIF